MKKRLCKSDKGVTLIELILVMAVLAVLAAIAVPRLSGFSAGREHQGEWNRLLASVRYARSEAVSRSTTMELRFDTSNRSYSLVNPNDPEATSSMTASSAASSAASSTTASSTAASSMTASSMTASSMTREHVLPKDLSFAFPDDVVETEGVVSVLFHPDGSVDKQSPAEIRLEETEGNFVRTLQQDPLLGYTAAKESDKWPGENG